MKQTHLGFLIVLACVMMLAGESAAFAQSVPLFRVTPSGLVGIGTNNPVFNLDVVGAINYTTCVYRSGVPVDGLCDLDERRMQNQSDLPSKLKALSRLKVVEFDYLPVSGGAPQRQLGVIAQQVQGVFPDVVRAGAKGELEIDLPRLRGYMTRALVELADSDARKTQEIDELKSEVAELKAQVKALGAH